MRLVNTPALCLCLVPCLSHLYLRIQNRSCKAVRLATSQESLLKREDRISSEFPLDVAFLMTKLILTQQLLVEDNHQDKSRHISVPTLHLWQLLWPVLLWFSCPFFSYPAHGVTGVGPSQYFVIAMLLPYSLGFLVVVFTNLSVTNFSKAFANFGQKLVFLLLQ